MCVHLSHVVRSESYKTGTDARCTVRGRDGDEMISHMFCAFRCIFHTEFYFRLGCCDLGDFVVGYIMSIK